MRKLLLLLPVIILLSCKKTAGEGGKASITGRIWIQDWDKNFNLIQYEYAGLDEDVYIKYGDHISYDDKITTNGNGEFEFKYLRPGKYQVYIFSDKKQTTASPSVLEAVSVDIEITSKTGSNDIGTLTIKK